MSPFYFHLPWVRSSRPREPAPPTRDSLNTQIRLQAVGWDDCGTGCLWDMSSQASVTPSTLTTGMKAVWLTDWLLITINQPQYYINFSKVGKIDITCLQYLSWVWVDVGWPRGWWTGRIRLRRWTDGHFCVSSGHPERPSWQRRSCSAAGRSPVKIKYTFKKRKQGVKIQTVELSAALKLALNDQ